MPDLLGIVIGTGILWGLKIFGTYPLAGYLSRGKGDVLKIESDTFEIDPKPDPQPDKRPDTGPNEPKIDETAVVAHGPSQSALPGICPHCGSTLKAGAIRCIKCREYVTNQQPSSADAKQPYVKAAGGNEFPIETYIMADCGVLFIGGLIISALTGWFFIGFSLRPRDWPGMIAFILASVFGASLAGIR
jgi:hypothetical protein